MTVLDPTSLRYRDQAVAAIYILIAGEEYYLPEEFLQNTVCINPTFV